MILEYCAHFINVNILRKIKYGIKKMSIYTNHYANQKKVQKTMPTFVPSSINKWQNSGEKSQAHNLKVVGSNPTPAINLLIKSMTYTHLKNFGFWRFFVF